MSALSSKKYVVEVARSLASRRYPLTPESEDKATSDYLNGCTEERAAFGRAVGRILTQAALLTSMEGPQTPEGPVPEDFRALFDARTHHNLEDCLASLAKRLPLSAEAFTLSLLYIDVLQASRPGLVCWGNMERLFAVGIVLASKFAYDRVYTNSYYARILGVDVTTLNKMEIAMLQLLNFDLTPSADRWCALHRYVAALTFENSLPAGTPRTPVPEAPPVMPETQALLRPELVGVEIEEKIWKPKEPPQHPFMTPGWV